MNRISKTESQINKIQYENTYLLNITSGDIEKEIEISEKALEILSTAPNEQRKDLLSELLRERAISMHHVAVNGITGTLFFNMNHIGLAPTPICPAYKKMQLPTISDYHTIAGNIANVKLDPSAIEHVPEAVRNKAGDLYGKNVECYWTAINGFHFHKNGIQQVNLCTHTWSHPHAQVGDWSEFDVNMGVFPEVGFQPMYESGAVACNDIGPMWVHTHIDGSQRYSPNNAHFRIIPKSPFGIFWTVTQKETRVAFTKVLVIFDQEHPLCQLLNNSIQKCNNLEQHLKHLENIPTVTQKTFNKLILLLDKNEALALEAFQELPSTFQYGIYQEAWNLFGGPCGVHGDFGKASFENDPSLDAKFHCSKEQRKQAVQQYIERLNHLLFHSQVDLLLNSQSLVKGKSALKMMQCAQLFKKNESKAAIELYGSFAAHEKNDVLFALWEVCRCPRDCGDNFGNEAIFSTRVSSDVKAEALILAASRQTFKLEEPSAIALEPRNSSIVQQEPIPVTTLSTTRTTSTCTTTDTARTTTSTTSTCTTIDVQPTTANSTSIAEPSHSISPSDVLEALMSRAPDFGFLSIDERKNVILELFNHLPTDIKNKIYGSVYVNSTDPNKGGENWGELHVADDLEVLINALADVLMC